MTMLLALENIIGERIAINEENAEAGVTYPE